ncbi:MAG: rod shape-determining protein MreC [Elusimicrobia bacterium RIFCSPLOWO2_01_FULL_60_11]|nr:MAG: rod shape-determining protein MreC [Elusimicrobia bacterium RIFCSPLOWO2_01_FULL_60_11]
MDWGIFRPSKSAALCLALLGVSFIVMTFRLSGAVTSMRTFLLYWISPIQQASSGSAQWTSDLGDKFIRLIRAHQENKALKDRILNASVLETQYQELLIENRRLRGLLKLKGSLPFNTQTARVIGRDPLNWTHAVWINRGSKDHVAQDSPVVAVRTEGEEEAGVVQGLIGRVLESSGGSSKVLLISDPLSSVAVSIPSIGELGLAQGEGPYLTVEYLELTSQAKPGDLVVTSGFGGIFPAGIPVGTLTRVEVSPSGFRRGFLKPEVSLNSVREVLILEMPRGPKD